MREEGNGGSERGGIVLVREEGNGGSERGGEWWQ